MTIDEIKEQIQIKRDLIDALSASIKHLQKQWISLLPIKVGDDIKVTRTNKNWEGEVSVTESSGRVTDIQPSTWYEDAMEYTALPFKKDGTVAKIGVFTCTSNETIEKLNQDDTNR